MAVVGHTVDVVHRPLEVRMIIAPLAHLKGFTVKSIPLENLRKMAIWGLQGKHFLACGAPQKEVFTAQPFDFRPLTRLPMVQPPVGVHEATHMHADPRIRPRSAPDE